MTSLRWLASGFFALVLLTSAGCGSDSTTPGGAGGGPGSGGRGGSTANHDAAGSGGAASGGVVVGSGGAGAGGVGVGAGGHGAGGIGAGAGGGGGSAVDAARDVAGPQLDVSADAPAPVDTAGLPVDAAIDSPILVVPDGGVTLAQVTALLAARCVGCHNGTGITAARLDLSNTNPDSGSSLYERLVGPLVLETYCGESLDAGGDAAVARMAIVPGDPADSFLYLKILGEQPSPGTPPANCGVQMPRVLVVGPDGGVTAVSCNTADGGAAANCLGSSDIELVHQWILEGAPH